MKILTISDKIEELIYSPAIVKYFGDVDLVISCGDLPLYYLEYVVSMLNKPLYYVFGNHGREAVPSRPGEQPKEPAGCINLDGRVIHFRGLLLAGLEGCMRYNDNSYFQYTEFQMRQKIFKLIPGLLWNRMRHRRYLDMLVTHAPPCGIHDAEDVCHTGFAGFLRMMEWFRPRYLIHGHTHLYTPFQRRRSTYHDTEIINSYGYQVLEFAVPPAPLPPDGECDHDIVDRESR